MNYNDFKKFAVARRLSYWLVTAFVEPTPACSSRESPSSMSHEPLSPSGQYPFSSRGFGFWTELFSEIRKLRLDRAENSLRGDLAYEAASPRITEIYGCVDAWHGTGRYHYCGDGKIVDVLHQIVVHDGLVPHEDGWDLKRGIVRVTCTAKSRMYARLYAGMHCPLGERIANELGTRELWAYYFFLTSSIVAIWEFRLSWKTVLKRDLTVLFPDLAEKTRRWVRKISSAELSQKDAFLRGTDIVQNYPILVGIKEGAFLPVETSKYIGLHERRACTRIALKDITHLEVPLTRVDETRQAFISAGIKCPPILPIEFGEEHSRSFSFAKLVGGDRLIDA